MSIGPNRPILIRNWEFRKPSSNEMNDITDAFMDDTGLSEGEAWDMVNGHREYIAVLDNYNPDSPGWSGKMAIMFLGEFDTYYLFRWTRNGIEIMAQN